MTYKKTTIQIFPVDDNAREILIAQLSVLGYESFMETEEGLEGFIQSDLFQPLKQEILPFLGSSTYNFEITTEDLEEKNWNEQWEKNYFKPILIGDQCLVRSPFHEVSPHTRYEILIEPKMAFGTGYHETTKLMTEHLLELNIEGQDVMDMGCGTGILGILASMRGASRVTGIDTDQWAVNNALENLSLNNITNMEIILGNASSIDSMGSFDLFLANINRNILLEDMPLYNHSVKVNGTIILSGFYSEDLGKIDVQAKSLGWTQILTKEQNNWIAVSYRKQ